MTVHVIGGGPAGSAAARLLSLWGHRVTISTRPSPLAQLAESIPPSCEKLLKQIGVSLDSFLPSRGNRVWWGGQERVVRFPEGTHGWQVPRDQLDALLLRAATEAGATIVDRVPEARWVLDCSGRTGVRARQFRIVGERTLALAARWSCPVDEDAETLVESYQNGWAWSVPYSRTERCIAFMIQPGRADYREEVRKVRHIASGATLTGEPFAIDATSYTAERFSTEGLLLVGDAATFVDPLSSYGIKKALASAWLAAIVTHTCLTEPELQTHALGFYDARERGMYEQLQRQSRQLASQAVQQHTHDFWLERASFEPAAARFEEAARAAFEQLKQRDSICLRPGAGVERRQLPVVRGNRIALAAQLVSAAYPDGIRYLRDVDLIKLSDLVSEHDQVPDLYEAYNRAAPPVALHDFLAALSTAIAAGLLEHSAAA